MAEPVMTDKDVVNLVRKEFERKVADYCKSHGIEVSEPSREEEPADEEDSQDDNHLGKRKPPSGKKPESLDIDYLFKSIGLRVSHKDSGLEYYLRGVRPEIGLIDLESPEGTVFQVDFNEFHQDYKLG